MQNLIKLLILLALVAGVVAYGMGWFDFNLGFNPKKMKDDLKGTGVEGLVGQGDDANGAAPKDDKGPAPAKDDRTGPAAKENQRPAGKSDGPKKDARDSTNIVGTVREERAEGIVCNVASKMPRFTIQLIDSSKKSLDNRVMTFDLAPQSEIRVNEVLSDFRALRLGSKVIVTFYLEPDPANMAPSKNMARLIVIEKVTK